MKDLSYYLNLKYPFTVSQDSTGSYLVEYPDLNGCFSCGDTLEDAIAMAEDAKLAWFETALENNIIIPLPKQLDNFSGNIKLRVPKSLHHSLSKNAKREGVSMNQYCVYLLSKECEHNSHINS